MDATSRVRASAQPVRWSIIAQTQPTDLAALALTRRRCAPPPSPRRSLRSLGEGFAATLSSPAPPPQDAAAMKLQDFVLADATIPQLPSTNRAGALRQPNDA